MLSQQVEALILASEQPLTLGKMRQILLTDSAQLHQCLAELQAHYQTRGIQLQQVAGGWQFRTAPQYSDQVTQLWQTRAPKLSRTMLETLAIIAYQQPITRAEIEQLRGIRVSSSILHGLIERGWVQVQGRKDMPGRPHIYGTGKSFLHDFGLHSLRDLPEAAQLVDIHDIPQTMDSNR